MRTQNQKRLKGAFAGVLGGLAASFVMNQFGAAWTKVEESLTPQKDQGANASSGGDDATVKTANAISTGVLGHRLEAGEKKWAGPAVHYAFGALVGGVYGVAAESAPVTSIGYGTAYGSAVWLLADEIAVPAAGLSGPPAETTPKMHVKAWASHLVYGLVTDLTRRAVLKAVHA